MPTKNYAPLSILKLKADMSYTQPVELPAIAHWEDPAMQVMVDFKRTRPDSVGADESIDTALDLMKACPYHVLFVIGKDQKIIGLISSEDLLGEKPLQAIQDRRLARSDISVRMVMTPHNEIIGIDLENLRHAKVGHIVSTLQAYKQHYALVLKVDETHQIQIVRGLFSLSLLSKQLGVDVMSDVSEAQSIAELHHDVHLHD